MQANLIRTYEVQKALEMAKTELERLQKTAKCSECGGPKSVKELDSARDRLSEARETEQNNSSRVKEYQRAQDQLKMAQESSNHYLEVLVLEQAKINPFVQQKIQTELEATRLRMEQNDLTIDSCILKTQISELEQLQDLATNLRAELIRKSVSEIESSTNAILERHFDSELRVSFTIEDADSLEVGIKKNGYDCVYKQLSKGQRQLLKLSFVLSVMKASANRIGTHFDNLFLDEALDGLDSSLKLKAFGLLQELSKDHGTVLVIDHSEELKECFGKRFKVAMNEDVSTIEAESE
jgi:DNA repair exonuclease SbcCD ATPase subunit